MRRVATLSIALMIAAGIAACDRRDTDKVVPSQPAVTALTPEQIAQRTQQRRAVEAVSWGMPEVNFDLMYQALVKLGGRHNQIVFWSGLPDWKNQTLTDWHA
jgi:hypothetical protein